MKKRKLVIEYKGKPVDMEMVDTILSCFNQELTIKDARYLINMR